MAFNAETGAVLWKTNVAERPPGAAGLIVFGGASDGTTAYYGLNQNGAVVAAVNLADGSRKWTTAPIAGARGISAANSGNDRVWCSATRLTEHCARFR